MWSNESRARCVVPTKNIVPLCCACVCQAAVYVSVGEAPGDPNICRLERVKKLSHIHVLYIG